jgi:hypothetical protein
VAVIRGHRRTTAPARTRDGEIDTIRERKPVHALEHEGEVELELQLDDDRRLVTARPDGVTAPDLALDLVALSLEKRLDGRIEIALSR